MRQGRSLAVSPKSPGSPGKGVRSSSTELREAHALGEVQFAVSPVSLGRGGYGEVCLAECFDARTGKSTMVAAKKPHAGSDPAVLKQEYDCQNAIASSLLGESGSTAFLPTSPSVCRGTLNPIGWMNSSLDHNPYLVMPLCPVSLSFAMPHLLNLKDSVDSRFAYLVILIDFLQSMGNALQSFDQAEIVHRDLKPDNIVLRIPSDDRHPQFVAADYGAAMRKKQLQDQSEHISCTPYYAAPEQFVGRCFNSNRLSPTKIDMYSLGMIIMEMLAKKPISCPGSDICQIAVWKAGLFKDVDTSKKPTGLQKKNTRKFHNKKIASWREDADVVLCIEQLAGWLISTVPEQRPSLPIYLKALNRIQEIFSSQINDDIFEATDKQVCGLYAKWSDLAEVKFNNPTRALAESDSDHDSDIEGMATPLNSVNQIGKFRQ